MQPTIRAATVADASGIRDIYEPIVRDTVISFETEPPDRDEIARRVDATMPALPWLVATTGGDVIGYAYASPHRARHAYRWSVEVSVYVAESGRRQGLGRRLYRALLDLLTRQGYFNAYGGITLPNDASVGLHETMGFEPVGVYRAAGFKSGAWHDVGWWQIRLRHDARPLADPLPFSQVGIGEDWERW